MMYWQVILLQPKMLRIATIPDQIFIGYRTKTEGRWGLTARDDQSGRGRHGHHGRGRNHARGRGPG